MKIDLPQLLVAPSSIFYPPYVFAAFALGYLLIWRSKKSHSETTATLFGSHIWLGPGLKIDLLCSCLFVLVAPQMIPVIDKSLFDFFYTRIRPEPFSDGMLLPAAIEVTGATLVSLISIDFGSYVAHRALHTRVLWWIHAFHHSARHLTPLTTYRQNPIEAFFLAAIRALSAGLALGLYHLLVAPENGIFMVGGMGFGIFLYMFTVNLHHFPIPLRYPNWLQMIFISPHIHHLHHSSEIRHRDRNFGVIFSFWDRLLGTYLEESFEMGELRFGIADQLPLKSPATAGT